VIRHVRSAPQRADVGGCALADGLETQLVEMLRSCPRNRKLTGQSSNLVSSDRTRAMSGLA
jgi:hypothetical protein